MTDILQPNGWPRPRGYSNGMKARGEMVFVAGQVGWDEEEKMQSGLVNQVRQALDNIVAVLAQGGAKPEHITRMTWYITDLDGYRANLGRIGEAYRTVIGKHYPVMSVVQVAGLLEEGAMVEIEATAVIPEEDA